MTDWRKRRREVAVILVITLAALALTAALVAAADHTRYNLSNTDSLISAYPDLAMSGERVSVVWTEDYIQGLGKGYGHVYLRDSSNSGDNWGNKITVFSGGSASYAIDASVAVNGSTAQVVYVVRDSYYYHIYRKTCDLAQRTCGGADQVANTSVGANQITWVDVAVDSSGNPHVVWARYDSSGQNGEIWYRAYNGSNWGGVQEVHTGGDDSAPAIAWANGYAHIVWNNRKLYVIKYTRCDASGCEDAITIYNGGAPKYAPYKPDVAAQGERVLVVWDWCSEDINHPPYAAPCDYFSLSYRRSDDNGAGYSWASSRDVGTDKTSHHEEYIATDNKYLVDEYLLDLQPSIALNDEGWPTVVWHVGSDQEGEPYRVYYAYALGGTSSSVNWVISHTVLNQDTSSNAGAATVGMYGQHLHAAYMQETNDGWDAYYEGFTYYPHAVIAAPSMVVMTQPVTINLDGSNSYDPQGAAVITWTWSLVAKPSGSSAAISAQSAVSPYITLDKLGSYQVTLQVSTRFATSTVESKTIMAIEQLYNVYMPLVMKQ